jgi:uncharacterized peroxidase-related enzyme
MSRIPPAPREQLAEFEPFFQMAESSMGFVPRSLYVMGRLPEILRPFSMLAATVLGPGTIDPGLKQLIAYVASNASGCRYCQAHTSAHAARFGVPTQKIEHAFEFESSPDFTAAERVALRLARDSAIVPNGVRADHFRELREHFGEEQIVEMVAVAALFGWLNRWNDTLATELEDEPRRFAGQHLTGSGWDVGKHGRP